MEYATLSGYIRQIKGLSLNHRNIGKQKNEQIIKSHYFLYLLNPFPAPKFLNGDHANYQIQNVSNIVIMFLIVISKSKESK